MDCRVVVEAAVPVYDVSEPEEAVRIAISKTGEMLNPDLSYVEIDMVDRVCPHCGDALDPAFIAADEALVALELEMTVFNVEREEHGARIAQKEIGSCLENIPLEVVEIEALPEEGEGDADADSTGDAGEGGNRDGDGDGNGIRGDDGDEDEDVLPEFDELLEDS